MIRVMILSALLPAAGRAQLAWNLFDETASTVVANAGDRITVTVPAGQRATLYAGNFVPLDLSAPASIVVTLNFTVSGGLSNLAAGTRAIGFGLFNNNGTGPGTTFADDAGYFAWCNGRSTGGLLELRRRNSTGTSASLLNPAGASFSNLGSGAGTQTAGALTNGVTYAVTLRLVRTATGISLGTNAATDAAGIWLRGDNLSETAYSSVDSAPAATVFNELGFMFLNTTAGSVTLTLEGVTGVTAISPPVITSPPAPLILNPGQSGTLSVTATGTPPLSYQWRKDVTPIAGATGPSYTVNAGQASDAGIYSVAVSNAYGSTTSSNAAVTISATNVPATIQTQPTSLVVSAGQPATFSVSAFGSAPLTYEWLKNGATIPGAGGPTLAIGSAGAGDAAVYVVVVRNSTTTAISNAITLTVNIPPAIATQPASVFTTAGQNVTFTVAATASPAPTFQWSKNGALIGGATATTLTLGNVGPADLGSYTVRVSNTVGAVTSAPALLSLPSTMTVAALAPAAGATGVNPDTPLRLTFDRAVRAGGTGRVRLFRASDNALVDTLDLATTPTRLIGTNPTAYNFYPLNATGNDAVIYPRAGTLAYGQTYYVTIEAGVVLDTAGGAFTGLSEPAAWRFTTKASGPPAGATAVTVAADGSGDFSTVQGAIDFVPAGNATRVVITVKKGTYNEINYIGATKPFVTVRGEDRAQSIIAYPNNQNFNGATAGNNRAMFGCDANDFTLETITLRNTTPKGGSQAEAVRGGGQRGVFNRVNLASFQDTLLWNGTLFVTDSYLEGDVDFMWGGGACYFQRCELKALGAGYYAQVRNGQGQKGQVYVDCRLTAAEGVTGVYLGRIDPTPAGFPFSQVVWLNCAMGAHIAPEGWQLNNATAAPSVQFWEYKSTDLAGATLDVSRRLRVATNLDDDTAAQYRSPQFVVGFSPQIAPGIETPPAAQSVLAGANARLTGAATGAPPPTYQWLKDGAPIAGATEATLVLAGVQPSAAGAYAVRATNSSGTVTSGPAALAVTRGVFAGAYFGTIGGGGAFALWVRDNGTAVFLARGASIAGSIAAHTLAVDGGGRFRLASGAAVVDATIDAAGNVSGSAGPAPGSGILAPTLLLAGARAAAVGPTQNFAGYFTLRSAGGSLAADLIVGTAGQAFAVVQDGTADGGSGTVDAAGRLSVTTVVGQSLTSNLAANASAAQATLSTAQGSVNRVSPLSGPIDAAALAQRLTGLATRARAGAGDGAAIVGFVIAGDAPRPILVRGVGPGLAALGVSGALTAPKLELFSGAQLLAANTGWTAGGNATSLAAASASVGLFALDRTSADSALALTLAPGAYTAIISGVNGATGNALVEIYDLAATNLAQRLSNLSTRAFAGRGDETLIGGLTVAGTQPKRLLIRAVGPGLAGFGVGGVLVRPLLTVLKDASVIAQNSNWSVGPDAPAIALATAESGAFPLAPAGAGANADAALLLNLAPGNYTAQVTGADGSTGVALLEIYELP